MVPGVVVNMSALVIGAFAAGMVATVNPCGFAMLPAYLGFFIGEKDPNRRSALYVGLAVSLGFVIVFVLAGVLVASGVRLVISWIPWLALLVGIGLVVAGIAELSGRHIYARLPGVKRASRSGTFGGLVGFGASYGVASLSCTLPIFLSLIAGSVAGQSLLQSVLVFFAYGAGMSLVVVVLTLGFAAGRDGVLRTIRPLASRLGTISGWILIVAGGFIVWYWATVLASDATALIANPLVRVFDRLTSGAAGLVSANPLLSAVVILGLGMLAAWWIKRDPDSREEADELDQSRIDV